MQDKLASLAAAKEQLREIAATLQQNGADPVINAMAEVIIKNACERLDELPEIVPAPQLTCSGCRYSDLSRQHGQLWCNRWGSRVPGLGHCQHGKPKGEHNAGNQN